MVAASPIIVDATVVEVTRGRIVGPREDPIQFRELELDVHEVLVGSLASDAVMLEEEGWSGADLQVSFSINDSRWANVGDRALWFIIDKGGAEAGYYRLVNSQSRFFLLGTDGVRSNRPDDELGRTVEQMGEARLRSAIAQASAGR